VSSVLQVTPRAVPFTVGAGGAGVALATGGAAELMLSVGLADGELFDVDVDVGVDFVLALAVSLQPARPKTVSPQSAATTTMRTTLLRALVSMKIPHQAISSNIELVDAFVNCHPPIPRRAPGRARRAR
jgi:hypothetical protein